MSYLDHASVREKVNAAVGVGALHAVLGAGLLIGLAVKVAPDRPPEPIIVQLQKPKEMAKPDLLPPPTVLDDIRVVTVEPVIDYREPAVNDDTRVPVVPDPLAGGAVAGGSGAGQTALVESKPVEPVRVAAVARPGTVGVRTDDYPAASRRAGEAGRVTIRVAIGADGSVKGCEVLSSSGHERLDKRTCEVAERRWRFSPATQDGTAIPSMQERSVLWRLEDLR